MLRHPWKGNADQCAAARSYLEELHDRQEREAMTLADLTGWKLDDIRRKMKLGPKPTPKAWWEGLWQ